MTFCITSGIVRRICALYERTRRLPNRFDLVDIDSSCSHAAQRRWRIRIEFSKNKERFLGLYYIYYSERDIGTPCKPQILSRFMSGRYFVVNNNLSQLFAHHAICHISPKGKSNQEAVVLYFGWHSLLSINSNRSASYGSRSFFTSINSSERFKPGTIKDITDIPRISPTIIHLFFVTQQLLRTALERDQKNKYVKMRKLFAGNLEPWEKWTESLMSMQINHDTLN